MRYASIVRELMTRLDFHSKLSAPGLTAPLLEGLKQMQAGEWRVAGDENLPSATVVDAKVEETPGRATGTVSILFSTARDQGFVQLEDTEDKCGLVDWAEKLMDALQTKPSDGQPDRFLIPHNTDGTLLPCGGIGSLLTVEFNLGMKMANISDLSYTAQIDVHFTPVLTARANRRKTPVAGLS